MAVKKIKKSISAKTAPKKFSKNEYYFLGLVALFAGFSLYATISFSDSTNNLIKSMQASVVSNNVVKTAAAVPAVYEIFSDVKSDMKYAFSIEKLKNEGLISGFSDGSFKPDEKINRSQVIAIILNAVDADFAGGVYGDCFSDVKQEWFAVPVCYAKKMGWVSGLAGNKFNPDGLVEYPEVLKWIVVVLGFEVPENLTVSPLPGVNITDWYAPYYKVAADYKLLDNNYFFEAGYKLSRAQFVELLYRAMKVKGLLK